MFRDEPICCGWVLTYSSNLYSIWPCTQTPQRHNVSVNIWLISLPHIIVTGQSVCLCERGLRGRSHWAYARVLWYIRSSVPKSDCALALVMLCTETGLWCDSPHGFIHELIGQWLLEEVLILGRLPPKSHTYNVQWSRQVWERPKAEQGKTKGIKGGFGKTSETI